VNRNFRPYLSRWVLVQDFIPDPDITEFILTPCCKKCENVGLAIKQENSRWLVLCENCKVRSPMDFESVTDAYRYWYVALTDWLQQKEEWPF